MRVLPALIALVTLVACSERPPMPCEPVVVEYEYWQPPPPYLDLLVVVGAAGADAEQHAARVRELERLLRILVTGDWEQDGSLGSWNDFEPLFEMRVGVITTNMGSGGHPVEGCAPYDRGDDATWRALDCARELPSFLSFRLGDDPDDFVRPLSCLATMPTCPIEQPLEAALKALSPSGPTTTTGPEYEPPRFFRDSAGHGDGANAGFLREDSLLAVIVLSGADDCSARDVSLYDPSLHPNPERACAENSEALHPISRFVEGLIALRPDKYNLVFSVIGGLPTDLVPEQGPWLDLEALEEDPRMQPRPDEADPSRLAAACESAPRGRATPAVRLIETADGLIRAGVRVELTSVCGEDYRRAIREIIRFNGALGPPIDCLRRPEIARECELDVAVPVDEGCESVPGSELRTIEEGLAFCTVPRIHASAEERAAGILPAGPGWLIDDYTEEARWVCEDLPTARLTVRPTPRAGTRIELRCPPPVAPVEGMGVSCDPEWNPCPESPTPLACDPAARTCGVPCQRDEDCAGLAGYRCDLRALDEIDPSRLEGDPTPRGFCASPTCG